MIIFISKLLSTVRNFVIIIFDGLLFNLTIQKPECNRAYTFRAITIVFIIAILHNDITFPSTSNYASQATQKKNHAKKQLYPKIKFTTTNPIIIWQINPEPHECNNNKIRYSSKRIGVFLAKGSSNLFVAHQRVHDKLPVTASQP